MHARFHTGCEGDYKLPEPVCPPWKDEVDAINASFPLAKLKHETVACKKCTAISLYEKCGLSERESMKQIVRIAAFCRAALEKCPSVHVIVALFID